MDNRSSTNSDHSGNSNASGHKTIGVLPKSTTRMQVLDPQQEAYAIFEDAWKKGKLNPHEGDAQGRYFTIDNAYSNLCHYNSNYYAIRDGRYIRHA